MAHEDLQTGDNNYQWTPSRILLAGVIIAIAAGSIAMVARRTLTKNTISFTPSSLSSTKPTTKPQIQYPTGGTFNFDNLQVSRSEILHGGPPKNGIFALTNPKSVPVSEADFLEDDQRVVGVIINNQARAYPIGILNWHEAINDVLGETPILIVYCPLCDSVTVTDRRINNKTHEFGISGLLQNSNVLLFDRTDDSLWSQLGFNAISGPNAGKSLTHLDNWEITSFEMWKKQHPDSTIVSFETGFESRNNYSVSPYGNYAETDDLMFPVDTSDNRLKLKDRIIAVKYGNTI